MSKNDILEYFKDINFVYNDSTKYDILKRMLIILQTPLDVSNMLYDIYMAGVNMAGEYKGVWVRFNDIETIVNKYVSMQEVKKDDSI